MSKYMTAQRRKLMSFLVEHPDKQFSAKEIAENLSGEEISMSAVYRNLNSLEEHGQIIGILHEGNREKFYRCVFSDECKSCIHITCTKCGKTFHLNEKEAQSLASTVLSNDNFKLNMTKTVLYGTCKNCD